MLCQPSGRQRCCHLSCEMQPLHEEGIVPKAPVMSPCMHCIKNLPRAALVARGPLLCSRKKKKCWLQLLARRVWQLQAEHRGATEQLPKNSLGLPGSSAGLKYSLETEQGKERNQRGTDREDVAALPLGVPKERLEEVPGKPWSCFRAWRGSRRSAEGFGIKTGAPGYREWI